MKAQGPAFLYNRTASSGAVRSFDEAFDAVRAGGFMQPLAEGHQQGADDGVAHAFAPALRQAGGIQHRQRARRAHRLLHNQPRPQMGIHVARIFRTLAQRLQKG